jgi:hypothetical protein
MTRAQVLPKQALKPIYFWLLYTETMLKQCYSITGIYCILYIVYTYSQSCNNEMFYSSH